MDLIDTNHRDAAAIFAEILSEKALWCDKEHLNLLVFDCCEDSLFGLKTLLRVNAGAWHEIWQFSKLISHQ